MERPRMRVSATVLDAPDAQALGAFYQRLLGWEVVWSEPGWMKIAHPLGELVAPGLSFQTSEGYQPPAWPNEPGRQQMEAHVDIGVADLAEGVAWAVECGATLAAHQPQDDVRVLLDPAGHPFCVFLGPVG